MSMEYIAETDGEMRMREIRNEKLRCRLRDDFERQTRAGHVSRFALKLLRIRMQ